MAGRTVIVTGASSGLGLGCARALLERDRELRVVLAVRDSQRGREAAAALGQPARCVVLPLELASLESVRGFVELLDGADLPPLSAVICNAGIQVTSDTRMTEDGVELTFGVNHLGHFALVSWLLERQLSAPARVVVVSSDTHDTTRRTGMPAPLYSSAEALAHPPPEPELPIATLGRRRYTTSKLCNVLFAYELDRRLGGGKRGITVNAFNPGLMPGSGLARDYGPVQRFAWRFVMPALRVMPQVRSPRQSGRDLAALAADARYEGVSGGYFDGLERTSSSPDSHDREKARELWQASERMIAAWAGRAASASQK